VLFLNKNNAFVLNKNNVLYMYIYII